ncbi:MAG: hypothetical protein ACTTKL_06025 [Treponema sp.]
MAFFRGSDVVGVSATADGKKLEENGVFDLALLRHSGGRGICVAGDFYPVGLSSRSFASVNA